MQKANDKRLTTNDPKNTIGISLRQSLVDSIRNRAADEDINFSAMCTKLLKAGLLATTGT